MNEIVLELLTKEIVILRAELQEARAEIELRGQSVATLSNYCNEDRETIAKLQSELQKFQSGFGHTNTQVEILQSINNGLLSELEELQSEKTNLLLHRNSLQAENNKLILERDELKTDLKEQIDAGMWLKHEIEKVIKDRDQLQLKNNELQKTNPKDAKALKKLQEELQDTKSKLQLAQIAYNENRKLIAERDELKARLESDQEFVRISKEESLNIRREFDRVSAERDQMWNNWQLALTVVADLQLKNDEKRELLKERGVIIDDSIVREESK